MSTPKSTYWQAIACDLDGTLLGRDLKIHPDDAAAVARARAAGLHVAICTGRNAIESFSVAHPLDLQGPGVYANGATICDMHSGKIIDYFPLPADLVHNLVEFFGSLGHAVLILAVDPDTHMPVYIRTQHGEPHPATVEWLIANKMRAAEMATIEPRFMSHIVRASIVVDVPEAAEIEKRLARNFGAAIYSCSIYSAAYNCQVIEAFAPNVNKWTGVEAMARHVGIDPSRVVTVGDDINDLQMLENASLSFAMGNATPLVQQSAKRTTAAQPQAGVAQVIDEILKDISRR